MEGGEIEGNPSPATACEVQMEIDDGPDPHAIRSDMDVDGGSLGSASPGPAGGSPPADGTLPLGESFMKSETADDTGGGNAASRAALL